jgi:hypothetical protein
LAIDRHEVSRRSGEPADALRLLLLDLISDARDVSRELVATLDATAWRAMLDMVRQHRLGALLHWQFEHRHAALAIPDDVREEVHDAWRISTRRMLGMQYELSTMNKLLETAGIRSVALKGPFLAYHAYPQPALRPMRDLDMLVAENRLIDAWNTLIAAGARPAAGGDQQDLRLAVALRADKHHLPGLETPSGFAMVELHRGIQSAASAMERDRNTFLIDDLWAHATTAPIGSNLIGFPAATDLLLHIIMHAAYDHFLNNGPLVLSDIAFLLRRQPIDWSRFWRTAEALRSMRGTVLLLDLAASYWRDLPIEWTADAITLRGELDTVRTPAALLLLQDRALTPEIWRKRGTGQPRNAARRVVARLLIPRNELALLYGIDPRSPRLLLCYPARWWRLATRRGPEAWHTGQRSDLRRQADADSRVSQWLRAA